jgi:Arm DNA-binding domain
MPVSDLSDAAIAAIRLPPGKSRIKRSAGGGLAIWVERNSKRWYLRTPNGSDVAIEGGTFPAMNLAAARLQRDVLLGMIERGIDPVAHKRQARAKFGARAKTRRGASADGSPVFLELAREFIDFQRSEGARPATLQAHEYRLKQLRPIHSLAVSELTVKVLAETLRKIADRDDRNEAAKRCAVLAAQILERGASTTDIGGQPAYNARLAAKGLPKPKVTSHAAITDPARFGELLRAVDAYKGKSIIVREALKLAAY